MADIYELKAEIFSQADYLYACANDPFFSAEEQDDFGARRESLFEVMRTFGWDFEYMGL